MATQTHEAGYRPAVGLGPVVVGVDGSRHGRSAALWASGEADQCRVPLSLVAACRLPVLSGQDAMTYPLREVEEYTRDDLLQLAQHLPNTSPSVHVDVATGAPDTVLLEAVDRRHAGLLVVGKRGLGTVSRALLGSTSIEVAGRSPVPVVVVPEPWVQTVRLSAPVVLGVAPRAVDPDVLDFAFTRADRLRVPLVALTAPRELPVDVFSDPDAASRRHDEFTTWARRSLALWRSRFPDVEVVPRCVDGDTAGALLDAAETAQLVVLGRAPRAHHQLWRRLSATTRAVLRDAGCPVAVVPSGCRADVRDGAR